MSESVIYDENDPRILQAARGVRPHIDDDSDVPSVLRFAPSAATYKVKRDGTGTSVYLYGTDEVGHSIAVRADHFRPYLYVSLERIDAAVRVAAEREHWIASLLAELQARLLLMTAYQQRPAGERKRADGSTSFTPVEALVFRETTIGVVRTTTLGDGLKKLTIERREATAAQPIVGHRISVGLPVKGRGENSGYRGNTATRYLQIYFYCPSLVAKARSILQGKNSDLDVREQIRRLSRAQKREEPDDPNAAATANTKLARGAHDERQRRLTYLLQPDPVDPTTKEDDADDDEEDEQNDEADAELERALAAGDEMGDHVDENDDEEYDVHGTSMSNLFGGGGGDLDGDDPDNTKREFVVEASAVKFTTEQIEKRIAVEFKRHAEDLVQNTRALALAPGVVYDVMEANVDFVLRFALDLGFAYEQWLTLDFNSTIAEDTDGNPLVTHERGVRRVTGEERETRLQIEVACDYRLLRIDLADPIQNKMPNHLLVSLDCEMQVGPNGEFARAKFESMLQCVFIIRGRDITVERTVEKDGKECKEKRRTFEYRSVSFTLGAVECRSAKREHCTERHILCFEDESTMFSAMGNFVRALDPHIVTGYNVDGFDFPWMLERARELGLGDTFARAWGRSRFSSRMTAKERSFQSSQAGTISFIQISAEGLIVLDFLKHLQRDPLVKLRSYSLNSVAAHYLGAQKEDVAYSLINTLQKSALGREKLRTYCEWDAVLPLLLFDNQQVMPSKIETARINVCHIEILLHRGQTIRSKCCLMRDAATCEPAYRFYTYRDDERVQVEESFKGAEVVTPKVGLYDKPVITLDQTAMYPSIMITHNLCFTTRVAHDYDLTRDPYIMQCDDPVNQLTLEERQRRAAAAVYVVEDKEQDFPYKEAPLKDAPRFLRHRVRLGIIPRVQINYLAHRKATKEAMKAAQIAGDEATAELLNQRQLAIKMSANSLYGYTGAEKTDGSCPDVSSTVTRRGRCLLFLMASIVRAEYAYTQPDVIYGETRAARGARTDGMHRGHRFNLCVVACHRDDRGGGQDRCRHGEAYYGGDAAAIHNRHTTVQRLGAGI